MIDVVERKPLLASTAPLMSGAPPFGEDRLVTLENWQDPPGNRWGFQHARELVPTARIRRGFGPVWALPRDLRDVLGVQFEVNGSRSSIGRLLDESYTDGFVRAADARAPGADGRTRRLDRGANCSCRRRSGAPGARHRRRGARADEPARRLSRPASTGRYPRKPL